MPKRLPFHHLLRKTVSFILIVAFSVADIFPARLAYSQQSVLPPPLAALPPMGKTFTPALIMGLNIHPDNPMRFDFLIDQGDDDLDATLFEQESMKLVKYFMAALTTPEKELWVNLSPYEKDRVIANSLGKTEMGKDLLTQDYFLKQMTTSLLSPQNPAGEKFWKQLQEKVKAEFGDKDIPLDVFSKIWIVPQEALIYEHEKGAYIVKSHLKVLLEADYLALEQSKSNVSLRGAAATEAISKESIKLIREFLLPEIEREVNTGKIFANLRQIYHAVILASWYKQALQSTILAKIYANQHKTIGIELDDKNAAEKIYDQYVNAFKKGAYDFLKEDYNPQTQSVETRRYISGGVDWAEMAARVEHTDAAALVDLTMNNHLKSKITIDFKSPDAAMTGGNEFVMLNRDQLRGLINADFVDHEEPYGINLWLILDKIISDEAVRQAVGRIEKEMGIYPQNAEVFERFSQQPDFNQVVKDFMGRFLIEVIIPRFVEKVSTILSEQQMRVEDVRRETNRITQEVFPSWQAGPRPVRERGEGDAAMVANQSDSGSAKVSVRHQRQAEILQTLTDLAAQGKSEVKFDDISGNTQNDRKELKALSKMDLVNISTTRKMYGEYQGSNINLYSLSKEGIDLIDDMQKNAESLPQILANHERDAAMTNISVATDDGTKPDQYDRYLTTEINLSGVANGKGRLLAVMDGSGGELTAEYLESKLKEVFAAALTKTHGDIERAWQNTVEELHPQIDSHIGDAKEISTLSAVYLPHHQARAYAVVIGDSPLLIIDRQGQLNVSPMHNMRINPHEKAEALHRGTRLLMNEQYIEAEIKNPDGTTTRTPHTQVTRFFGFKTLGSMLNRTADIYSVELGKESVILLASDGLEEEFVEIEPLDQPYPIKIGKGDFYITVDSYINTKEKGKVWVDSVNPQRAYTIDFLRFVDTWQRLVRLVKEGKTAQDLINITKSNVTGINALDNMTAIVWRPDVIEGNEPVNGRSYPAADAVLAKEILLTALRQVKDRDEIERYPGSVVKFLVSTSDLSAELVQDLATQYGLEQGKRNDDPHKYFYIQAPNEEQLIKLAAELASQIEAALGDAAMAVGNEGDNDNQITEKLSWPRLDVFQALHELTQGNALYEITLAQVQDIAEGLGLEDAQVIQIMEDSFGMISTEDKTWHHFDENQIESELADGHPDDDSDTAMVAKIKGFFNRKQFPDKNASLKFIPFSPEEKVDFQQRFGHWNLEWALQVPWEETVRNIRKQPEPKTQNEQNYFSNQKEVRPQALKLLWALAKNPDMTTLEFAKQLLDIKHLLFVGSMGKSFYYPKGLVPGMKFEDDRFAIIKSLTFSDFLQEDELFVKLNKLKAILLEFINLHDKQASYRIVLDKIAEFYAATFEKTLVAPTAGTGRDPFIFPRGNNSLFRNFAYGMLRLIGLNGFLHGYIDQEWRIEDFNDGLKEEFMQEILAANPQVLDHLDDPIGTIKPKSDEAMAGRGLSVTRKASLEKMRVVLSTLRRLGAAEDKLFLVNTIIDGLPEGTVDSDPRFIRKQLLEMVPSGLVDAKMDKIKTVVGNSQRSQPAWTFRLTKEGKAFMQQNANNSDNPDNPKFSEVLHEYLNKPDKAMLNFDQQYSEQAKNLQFHIISDNGRTYKNFKGKVIPIYDILKKRIVILTAIVRHWDGRYYLRYEEYPNDPTKGIIMFFDLAHDKRYLNSEFGRFENGALKSLDEEDKWFLSNAPMVNISANVISNMGRPSSSYVQHRDSAMAAATVLKGELDIIIDEGLRRKMNEDSDSKYMFTTIGNGYIQITIDETKQGLAPAQTTYTVAEAQSILHLAEYLTKPGILSKPPAAQPKRKELRDPDSQVEEWDEDQAMAVVARDPWEVVVNDREKEDKGFLTVMIVNIHNRHASEPFKIKVLLSTNKSIAEQILERLSQIQKKPEEITPSDMYQLLASMDFIDSKIIERWGRQDMAMTVGMRKFLKDAQLPRAARPSLEQQRQQWFTDLGRQLEAVFKKRFNPGEYYMYLDQSLDSPSSALFQRRSDGSWWLHFHINYRNSTGAKIVLGLMYRVVMEKGKMIGLADPMVEQFENEIGWRQFVDTSLINQTDRIKKWLIDEAWKLLSNDRKNELEEFIIKNSDKEAYMRVNRRLSFAVSPKKLAGKIMITGRRNNDIPKLGIQYEPIGAVSAEDDVDRAQISTVPGGIDLNPTINQTTIQKEGAGVNLPVSFDENNLPNIQGLVPVIIKVEPIINLLPLLGLKEQPGQVQVSAKI